MAAAYEQPKDVVKRVRFFDGQYLQDQDFVDEQHYQIDRQRRHSRTLHVAGIAEGLGVTAVVGAPQVVVAAGTAIDADGRQIVVIDEPVAARTLNLTNYLNRTVNLYLLFQDVESNPQASGSADFGRWLEQPQFVMVDVQATHEFATPPVLLGRVVLNSTAVETVDASVRVYSGLRLPGPTVDAPTLRTAASGLVGLTGSLTVEGNVGIGTTSPSAKVEIAAPTNGIALKVGRRGGQPSIKGVGDWLILDGPDEGQLGLNYWAKGNVTIANGGGATIVGGALSVNGNLSFGSAMRQMVNLWSTGYGIGIQSSTQYFRTDKNFAWYKGGAHNDGELNTGASGTVQMVIKDGNVGIGTADPGSYRLNVNGDLTVSSIRSKPQTFSFKVAGSDAEYYPVVFTDNNWADGAMILEIVRPDVHTDAGWKGALISRFVCHSTNYGHGADFLRTEIYQSKTTFIAGYENELRTAQLIVWLKGNTTYSWRANHFVTLTDYNATAKTISGTVYAVKQAVESYVRSGAVHMRPGLQVDGKVGIGTASPVGRLDVRDSDYQFTLTNSDKNDSWGLTNWNNSLFFQYRASATASATNQVVISSGGKMGIGMTNPAQKLMVVGAHNDGKDADSGMSYAGQFAIKGNAPQIDFIDTDHNDWSIHVNSNKLYFIRQPWTYTDLVLDGSGNVGIGTDAPSTRLEVSGAGKFTGALTINGGLAVPGGVETLRMLRGIILGDARIYTGSGFSVSKAGTGLYDITFAQAFPSVPAASATQIYGLIDYGNATGTNAGGNTRDNAVIAHLSANKMRVKTGNGEGDASDRPFSLVVIGPQ